MTFPMRFGNHGFQRIIRYKGVFDFDGVYKYIVKWIKNNDYDFYEKKVWDYPPYKVYKLEGRKKISYMTMFLLFVEIWVWEDKPVEIVRDGKVKHLTEARMKILFDGGYTFDYDGDFEKSPGLKKIEKFLLFKIMFHDMFLKWYDFMDYFVHSFVADVKDYLEMETASNAY